MYELLVRIDNGMVTSSGFNGSMGLLALFAAALSHLLSLLLLLFWTLELFRDRARCLWLMSFIGALLRAGDRSLLFLGDGALTRGISFWGM